MLDVSLASKLAFQRLKNVFSVLVDYASFSASFLLIDRIHNWSPTAELMLELAIKKPKLQRTVTAILIANEENGVVKDIGVDRLMQTGKMDHMKSGPVIWVDCADMQPCTGTAGSVVWHLKAVGKLFHSGLPHKGINAIEFANAALAKLQDKFYETFVPTETELAYKFATVSTMKPTLLSGFTASSYNSGRALPRTFT